MYYCSNKNKLLSELLIKLALFSHNSVSKLFTTLKNFLNKCKYRAVLEKIYYYKLYNFSVSLSHQDAHFVYVLFSWGISMITMEKNKEHSALQKWKVVELNNQVMDIKKKQP